MNNNRIMLDRVGLVCSCIQNCSRRKRRNPLACARTPRPTTFFRQGCNPIGLCGSTQDIRACSFQGGKTPRSSTNSLPATQGSGTGQCPRSTSRGGVTPDRVAAASDPSPCAAGTRAHLFRFHHDLPTTRGRSVLPPPLHARSDRVGCRVFGELRRVEGPERSPVRCKISVAKFSSAEVFECTKTPREPQGERSRRGRGLFQRTFASPNRCYFLPVVSTTPSLFFCTPSECSATIAVCNYEHVSHGGNRGLGADARRVIPLRSDSNGLLNAAQ